MDSSALDYDLPPELIAQHPADPRDASRLLVYDRATGELRHRRFHELPDELTRGELVVVNDTRVIPARLRLQRPGGGAAEVLLLEPIGDGRLGGARAAVGHVCGPGAARRRSSSSSRSASGRWRVAARRRAGRRDAAPAVHHRAARRSRRYQTVYARDPGSAAAPTAGLHFTPELLAAARRRTRDAARRSRHVPAAHRPTLEEHRLHGERYAVAPAAWERIAWRRARARRRDDVRARARVARPWRTARRPH